MDRVANNGDDGEVGLYSSNRSSHSNLIDLSSLKSADSHDGSFPPPVPKTHHFPLPTMAVTRPTVPRNTDSAPMICNASSSTGSLLGTGYSRRGGTYRAASLLSNQTVSTTPSSLRSEELCNQPDTATREEFWEEVLSLKEREWERNWVEWGRKKEREWEDRMNDREREMEEERKLEKEEWEIRREMERQAERAQWESEKQAERENEWAERERGMRAAEKRYGKRKEASTSSILPHRDSSLSLSNFKRVLGKAGGTEGQGQGQQQGRCEPDQAKKRATRAGTKLSERSPGTRWGSNTESAHSKTHEKSDSESFYNGRSRHRQGSGLSSGGEDNAMGENGNDNTDRDDEVLDPVQIQALRLQLVEQLSDLKDTTDRYCDNLGTVSQARSLPVNQLVTEIQQMIRNISHGFKQKSDDRNHLRTSYVDGANGSPSWSPVPPPRSRERSSSPGQRSSRDGDTDTIKLRNEITPLAIRIRSLEDLISASNSYIEQSLSKLKKESRPPSRLSPSQPDINLEINESVGNSRQGTLNSPSTVLTSAGTSAPSPFDWTLPLTWSESHPELKSTLIVEAAGIEVEVKLVNSEPDATSWVREQITKAIREEQLRGPSNTPARLASACSSNLLFSPENWWTAEVSLPTIADHSEVGDWFRPIRAPNEDAWMDECLWIRRKENLKKWKNEKNLVVAMKKGARPPTLQFVKQIGSWPWIKVTKPNAAERDLDVAVVGKVVQWSKLKMLHELKVIHNKALIEARLKWKE